MKRTIKPILPLSLSMIPVLCFLSNVSGQDLTPKVLELFESRCQECHSADTNDDYPYLHKGVTVEELIADEAVVPGKPEESPVLGRILLDDDSRKRMPKSRGAEGDDSYSAPLSEDEKKMISDWIVQLGSTAKAPAPTPLTVTSPPEVDAPEEEAPETPGTPSPAAAEAAVAPAVAKAAVVETPKPEEVKIVSVEDAKPADVMPSGVSLQEKVHWIFEQRCSKCHSGDYDPELHGTVNLTQFFTEKDATGSGLLAESVYERVILDVHDSERMPKSKGEAGDKSFRPPLVDLEVDALKKWIEAGRPKKVERALVSNTEMISTIHKDLEGSSESKRKFFRYLTLTNLHNATDADGNAIVSDLNPHRAAMSKLMNSLSMNAKITMPRAIDEHQTIFRVDLRDYNWTADDWERVIGYYPYGIIGINSQKEKLIERYTDCKMAYVRADWFVFAASQPPLYDEMLDHMLGVFTEDEDVDIVSKIEDRLSVDRFGNLREGNAMRAGFQFSGVSQANRLAERHELGAWNGAYWVSYDFTPLSTKRTQEIKLAPLGPPEAGLTDDSDHCFEHDGGEMIFNLPNGLQAYLLATADGKRLKRGPIEIVQDKNRPDSVILNGISCMACHDQGIKPAINVADPKGRTLAGMTDEVRPLVEAAGILNFEEKKLLEKLHVKPEILQAAVKKDYERFQTAEKQAVGDLAGSTEPVLGLYNEFKAPVTARKLASEIGMEFNELIQLLDEESDQGETLSVISSSMSRDLAIRRENILREYIAVVYALGYELMPFTPLGYEDFGGDKYANLISGSDQYLGAFGGSVTKNDDYTVSKSDDYTVADAKKAVVTSKAAAETLSSESVLLHHGGKLKISIQPTLHVGERAKLGIVATADTHIRVFHFSSDKHVTELFPGKLGKSTLRPKNKKLEVSWQTTKPAGAEHVIVYAAESEITNIAKGEKVGDFTVYDKDDVYSTRGIPKAIKAAEVKEKTSVPAKITEARIGYVLKD